MGLYALLDNTDNWNSKKIAMYGKQMHQITPTSG